jgi:hypothetical protein
MATFDQVTVTGSSPFTDVGFQTDSAEGYPIQRGVEVTGLVDGVRGSAGAGFDILKTTGNGVSGIGGGFDTVPGGSGVYGQGTNGPGVTGQGADANALFVSQTSSQGVVGQGGAADVQIVSVGGAPPEAQSDPGSPGVVGIGGAGASTGAGPIPQLAPPGPGVVGTGGGAADNDQQSGTGVVGVAGGVQFDPTQSGGYGGVFVSSQQGQVRLVPETGTDEAAVPLPTTAQAGDLFVRSWSDASAELWFCGQSLPGAAGRPPQITWKRVAFDQTQIV